MNSFESLLSLPQRARVAILATLHCLMFIIAFVAAFLIRFDFFTVEGSWDEWRTSILYALPVLVGLKLATFAAFKMYQGWWRYVSLLDVVSLFRALAAASTLFVLANVFVTKLPMPRSIYILDFGLSLVLIGGARGSLRLLREAMVARRSSSELLRNTLILGAGDTGETLLREITKNVHLPYKAIGFLDDDPKKLGLRIHNVSVLGTIEELPDLVEQHNIQTVIIAMPSASKKELRRVVDIAKTQDVEAKILPAVESILDNELSLGQLREVSIDDLLGREQIQLDMEAIGRFLTGRVVMVTGAGGSIGSELCRQVLRFEPSELVMIERGETPLFFVERELRAKHAERLVPYVASITEASRMDELFRKHKPAVVLHAAAYKHVPLMEANPCEAVKNNVAGTQTIADLAITHGTDTFVLISTDKAVNPTSVMGATKRVTELYLKSIAERGDHDTRFSAVRFGNVLGSNGSVVPIFRDQIKRGGPVTVTHPEMTRYFMTIPEATQLVLQAGALGHDSDVFILDMGEPVKISDLARDMIRLSGLNEEDIDVVYTGVRPGEKLYEELALNSEEVDKTTHDKIFVACSSANEDLDTELYTALIGAARGEQPLEVRRHLKTLIPTYHHPEIPDNVVSLDTSSSDTLKNVSR